VREAGDRRQIALAAKQPATRRTDDQIGGAPGHFSDNERARRLIPDFSPKPGCT
jgi:hypothetical protein